MGILSNSSNTTIEPLGDRKNQFSKEFSLKRLLAISSGEESSRKSPKSKKSRKTSAKNDDLKIPSDNAEESSPKPGPSGKQRNTKPNNPPPPISSNSISLDSNAISN